MPGRVGDIKNMRRLLFFKKTFRFKYSPDAVMDSLARHLNELKKGSKVKPKRLFVYPTCLCNDSCRYCSDGLNNDSLQGTGIKYDKARDFFSRRSYIDRLIKDIRRLRIVDLHLFGGGEPFFYRENMFYFLERLKKTDVFIRVITNTKQLDEESIARIVKQGLISQLNISLNTDSEDTARKIYPDPSRHQHSIDVLKWLTRFKALYKTDFPKVDIMTILLKINYDKILDIIGLLSGYSINYLFFQPLRVYSEKQKEFLLSPEEQRALERQIPEIQKRLDALKIRSNIEEFRPVSNKPADPGSLQLAGDLALKNKHGLTLNCYMPLTTASICYNGNMPLCQFKYDRQYKRNYFDTRGLEEFTKSREYCDFTGKFIEGMLPELCDKCNFCVPHELNLIRERVLRLCGK